MVSVLDAAEALGNSSGQSQVAFAEEDAITVLSPRPELDPDDADSHVESESFVKKRAKDFESSVQMTDAESFVRGFASSPLRNKLKRVFDTFDIDRNGEISIEEVLTMVRTLHVDFPEDAVVELMHAADTDGNGEVDFEEFSKAAEDTGFAELVTAASFPAEIYKILEEGNLNFLSTFQEFVIEIMDSCQKEVLAAKVPLASYGRVHTALNDVKEQLTGTAQKLLTSEFSQLRTGALESLKAQREAIEARHRAKFQAVVEPIRSEADRRVAEAERNVAAAEAEAARLQSLYSSPEAVIAQLQNELSAANSRAAELESRVKAYEDDWSATYPKVLATCSVEPPPLPADAPFIVRTLEQRGLTIHQLFRDLDPEGSGVVTKAGLRKSMLGLGLLPSEEHEKQLQQKTKEQQKATDTKVDTLLGELDARIGLKIEVGELRAILFDWEGPPSKAKGGRGQTKAAKEKTGPHEGALERALDRAYASELHGSRFLFVVEQYEKLLKSRERKHAEELRTAIEKAAADGSSASIQEEERTKAWEAERAAVQAKHAAQLRAIEEQLEVEKAERLQEVAKLRESMEASAAEAVRAERVLADELRAKVQETEKEARRLTEQLSSTTLELKATVQDKEQKQLEVNQTQEMAREGSANFEARLHQALDALRKVEAAQPTNGGYYFAAAPLRGTFLNTGSPRSARTSPERLRSSERVLEPYPHRLSDSSPALSDGSRRLTTSPSPSIGSPSLSTPPGRASPPRLGAHVPLRTPTSTESTSRGAKGRQSRSRSRSRRKSS